MDDWDQRMLCADGACNGVIGDDGTCKVCGRAAPNWGDERNRGLNVEAEASDLGPQASAGEPDSDSESDRGPKPEARGPDDDWERRELCPDGGCNGVIGADGKCTVCGRTAA